MPRHSFVAALLFCCGIAPVQAQQAEPVPVEVFPFELEDKSAGAGIVPPDDYDRRYLAEAAKVARDMFAETGRYTLVTNPVDSATAPATEPLRHCGGCEAGIARSHGASLAVLGVVTRVNRTEHTMFIRVLDVHTGKPVAVGFTDLRMGANHAWPRTAKWLMKNRILK